MDALPLWLQDVLMWLKHRAITAGLWVLFILLAARWVACA